MDMTVADQLFKLAADLKSQGSSLNDEGFSKPLQLLTDAAEEIGKAWSGSWLGYRSRVYYNGLVEPPPGAQFSQEWGMKDTYSFEETVGDWKEYRFDDVISSIYRRAGDPDTSKQEKHSSSAKEHFDEAKSRTLSLLSVILDMRKEEKYLSDIVGEVEETRFFGVKDFIEAMRPRQNVIHEAGLFQGRPGFKRAIILLEDGCEEFSNVHGLGQIRFPGENVSAVFEDVRRVLEREGLSDEK